MGFVTLSTFEFDDWNWGGSTGFLRIFASAPFYESTTSVYIPGGVVTQINSPCQVYDTVISGTTVTIPPVTIATTTDSSNPAAVYTAVLYDSANRRRYTLLANFFVDPNNLNNSLQSSALVTNAGTSAANGIYTYRGQNDGKGSYNLESFSDNVINSATSWASGASVWRIYDNTGTALYRSTDNVDYPWQVTTWLTVSGIAPGPSVVEDADITTSTWQLLTLANSGFATAGAPFQWEGPFWNVMQTKQYVDSIVGDGTTPFANEIIVGKVSLSADPLVATDPIAVGTQDTVWLATNETVFQASYGVTQADLTASLAAIGSVTLTELKLTSQVSVTSNTTVPANVKVTFEGDGSFTVAGGITLTLSSMEPTASRRVFFGSGNVVFAKNAVPSFDLSWWAGVSNSGDLTHAFDQITTSLTNNLGGVLNIGPGDWKTTNFTPPSGSIIQGAGNADDTSKGTALRAFAGTGPTVRIGEDIRDVVFRNLTISNRGLSAINCVLFEGSGADPTNTCLGVYFDNVTFHAPETASTAAVRVHSTASDWECIVVAFSKCMWIIGAGGTGFDCDTVNSSFTFDTPTFYISAGGTAIHADAIGPTEVINPDWRGPGAAVPTSTVDRTVTASVTAGVITVTSGALTLSDVGQRFVRDTVDSVITGITSSTTATLDDTGAAATLGTASIYRYIPSTLMPKACIWIEGSHGSINVRGGEDEGYQYFIINDGSTLDNPIKVDGAVIQSIIQLNQSCALTLDTCGVFSQVLEDNNPATGRITTVGCSVKTASILSGTSIDLVEPTLWGVHDGTSIIATQLNTEEGVYNQGFGETVQIFHGEEFAANPQRTIGVLEVGSTSTPLGGVTKPAIKLGLIDPVTGNTFLHSYAIQRDGTSGYMTFIGSQAVQFCGYDFNGVVQGTTFIGDANSPAQITSNQNDYNPGNMALLQRWNTDASRNITGIALPAPSQVTGQQIIIANVLTQNIVLKHQDTGSTATARFLNVTGADITLAANEIAQAIYDGTTQRWRTWKTSITGISTSGSNVSIAGSLTINGGTAITTSNQTGSGLLVTATAPTITSPVLVTPAIGVATGTSLATTGLIKSSGTAGIGYSTGAGGAISQGTSRTTTVILNKTTGAITLFAAVGSVTPASFTVTNSTVIATDVIIMNQKSGTDKYEIFVTAVGAGSFEITSFTTGGTTNESPVFNFCVIKGVAA